MTEQERLDAFITGIKALEQAHGITITAEIAAPEQAGALYIMRPQLRISVIEGWQPPAQKDE